MVKQFGGTCCKEAARWMRDSLTSNPAGGAEIGRVRAGAEEMGCEGARTIWVSVQVPGSLHAV